MNLQRKKQMSRGSGLKRTGRISIAPGKSWANPAKPRKPLQSKPAPMSPEEKAGKKGVRLRSVSERPIDGDLVSGEWCECCTDDVFGSEWSHRVGRGQCGTWDIPNGLWSCARCHRWMHDNPNAAKAKGWHVHPAEDPEKRQVLRRGEWVWLRPDGSTPPAPPPSSLPFEEAS